MPIDFSVRVENSAKDKMGKSKEVGRIYFFIKFIYQVNLFYYYLFIYEYCQILKTW